MHSLLIQVIFYIFAAITVFCGLMVISQNNPVRCVLFLVLAFFASSVLWILAKAEFLALILVLVYVGAVMTLFLFVVMMLNIDTESMKTQFMRYLPFGLIMVALLVSLLLLVMPKSDFSHAIQSVTATNEVVTKSILASAGYEAKPVSNTEDLGMVLYTEYLFAFELAAAILLVAIIAAISLVHKPRSGTKKQNIVKQLMTRREDRVSLISMKSEK